MISIEVRSSGKDTPKVERGRVSENRSALWWLRASMPWAFTAIQSRRYPGNGVAVIIRREM